MMTPNPTSSNAAVPSVLLCAVVLVAIQNAFPFPQGLMNGEVYGNTKIENTTITDGGEHLELPLTSTKGTVQTPPLHNDSIVCFPYFLSQEIESLLNQALKMLSKSKNERQKSWLRFFVHRLESLSTQLRKLPTEHKNRCYHTRERMVVDENNSNLLSAPEEIQLRFARKLFLSARPRVTAVRPTDRLKEYVTGIISAERNQMSSGLKNNYKAKMDAENNKSSPRETAQNAHQSNKNNEENSDNSEISRNLDLDKRIRSSPTLQYQNSKSNPNSETTMHPLTRWENRNLDYENMLFLPRSTRKSMPYPIEEKMKFRAALSSLRNPRTTTSGEQEETETPTVLPTFQNEESKNDERIAKKESVTTNSPLSGNYHQEKHHGSSTQQYEEANAQIHDQEFNLPPLTNREFKTTNLDLSTAKTIQKIEDDDLVIQLHSGGKSDNVPSNQHMHPRLLMNNKQVHNWPQVTPSEVASKSPKTDEIPSHNELENAHGPSFHSLLAKSNAASKANTMQNNDLTNLDFDYEEQGAAAGELFIDDEFLPTKSIAVPSTIKGMENTDSGEDDDIVKQLDELKSLKSSGASSNKLMSSTNPHHTITTSKNDVQDQNVPHLVDDK